jgi:hypothetical protein
VLGLVAASVLLGLLEAEQPTVTEAIAMAREQVLMHVGRQLAAREAQRRGLLPVVVGELIDDAMPRQDLVCAAIDEAVQGAAQAFRTARLAETQHRRALMAARHVAVQTEQALAQAQRDAMLIARAPALWRKRQAVLAAREADPVLRDFNRPGDRQRAKARHEQAMAHIEAEIAGVLQTAGVA